MPNIRQMRLLWVVGWLFRVFLRPLTSKSLCFGDLIARHHLGKLVSYLGGLFMPLCSDKLEPHVCLYVALRHTSALGIHDALVHLMGVSRI